MPLFVLRARCSTGSSLRRVSDYRSGGVSVIEILQQLSQDDQGYTGEEQAETSNCEAPRSPWSCAIRKNSFVELAELDVGDRSPKNRLELLVRWQPIIHFKLKFPILIIA